VLNRQALSALSSNPLTRAYDIGVEVRSGVATLTGKVQNAAEKAEAEAVVGGIAGISDVINELAVVSPIPFAVEYHGYPYYPSVSSWALYAASLPLKTDLEIERDIRQALKWSPYVNAKDIHVRVREGVATLTGKVKTLRARRAAEANAYQGGAVKTVDDIEVTAS
jgi:osmotically-inducible protein OsmY